MPQSAYTARRIFDLSLTETSNETNNEIKAFFFYECLCFINNLQRKRGFTKRLLQKNS